MKRSAHAARLAGLLVLGLILGNADNALAQKRRRKATEEDKQARARQNYEKGIKHYNLGEFDEAITAFKGAYEMTGAPALLFNLAQCYRLKDDYRQALFFYKTYLRLQPDAPNRGDVQERIAEMEKLLAQFQRMQEEKPRGAIPPGSQGVQEPDAVTSSTTAAASSKALEPPPTLTAPPSVQQQPNGAVTDAAAGKPAGARPGEARPGEARPGEARPARPGDVRPGQAASAASEDQAKTTPSDAGANPIGAGTRTLVEVSPRDPAPSRPPAPEESRSPGRGKKILGLTTAGIGAALVATGAVFGFRAAAAFREIEDQVAQGGTWGPYYEQTYDRALRARMVSIISVGAGVAALTGGGLLWALGAKEARAGRVSVALAPFDAGFHVVLAGSY